MFAAVAWAGPKVVVRDNDYDFGYTPEGLSVIHRFWVLNGGDADLRISKVRPTCGCTSVPLTKNLIPPHDSVAMDVKFDTRRFHGKVAKSAGIECNDTTQVNPRLRFTATVNDFQGWVEPRPWLVYLDTLGKDQQVILLLNKSSESYKVSVKSPPSNYLEFELLGTEVPPHGQIQAVVRTTAQTPVGEYYSSVSLFCDGPEPHTITIPIYGMGYLK
jgi:hypothetical protein